MVIAATALLGHKPATAAAHSGVHSYLYVDVTTDELAGRVELPFGDLRTVFDLSLDGRNDAVLEELRLNKNPLVVSQGTKMVSLLGRNVGIEIGQTVAVLLVFPALFLLRRTRWYRPFFVVASIGLAIVACGWMIERLFVVDLKIGRVIDAILDSRDRCCWSCC